MIARQTHEGSSGYDPWNLNKAQLFISKRLYKYQREATPPTHHERAPNNGETGFSAVCVSLTNIDLSITVLF